MSFLSEVLKSVDQTDAIDLNEFFENVKHFKLKINEHMQNVYVNFQPLENNFTILSQSKQINDDLDTLIMKVQEKTKREINSATQDLKQLSQELQEIKFGLCFSFELIKIHESFEQIDLCKQNKQYMKAAEKISQLNEYISKPSNDIEYLDVFESIKEQYLRYRYEVLNKFKTVWQDCLTLSMCDEQKHSSIKVYTKCLDDMILSLNILSLLQKDEVFSEIKVLSVFLLDNVFVPIIRSECSIALTTCEEYVILDLHVVSSDRPEYKTVFENIMTIFQFLKNWIDFEINDKAILSLIGKKIGKNFCDTLIEDCLIHTVPLTLDEMNNYDIVIQEVQQLQVFLFDVKFLIEEEQSILEYANNVDVLFANKLCETFVQKAILIIKKDLYNMTEVGSIINSKEDINSHEYIFPKCQISLNTQELVNLVYEILELATKSSDMCAGRLIQIAQKIFELFRTVTPEHHRKFLQTIPQQAALFYNNCMYLANDVLKIEEKYKDRFSKVLQVTPISFVDHFIVLRELGKTTLQEHIDIQKKQLLDILNDSGLLNLGQNFELDQNTEKSVRQCLRQLEILQTVWGKVLPIKIYNKSMGYLIDSFVEDLINKVIAVEDISAETGVQLVYMFKLIKQRAPKVLEEPNEIHRYSKLWMKFDELIFLLEATLIDIEARWADGKGPLALEFKASEIKSLIRALFQNTDRRAAILNKIV